MDKIVSKGKKYDKKTKIDEKPNNKDILEKNINITQNKIVKTDSKLNNSKKNIADNISKPLKKTKDPVQALVDREIKPIIKKWISKNLKSFVKTIVIQEMKLISKLLKNINNFLIMIFKLIEKDVDHLKLEKIYTNNG